MVLMYLGERGPYKQRSIRTIWVDQRPIKPDATVVTRWVESGKNTITHHLSSWLSSPTMWRLLEELTLVINYFPVLSPAKNIPIWSLNLHQTYYWRLKYLLSPLPFIPTFKDNLSLSSLVGSYFSLSEELNYPFIISFESGQLFPGLNTVLSRQLVSLFHTYPPCKLRLATWQCLLVQTMPFLHSYVPVHWKHHGAYIFTKQLWKELWWLDLEPKKNLLKNWGNRTIQFLSFNLYTVVLSSKSGCLYFGLQALKYLYWLLRYQLFILTIF